MRRVHKLFAGWLGAAALVLTAAPALAEEGEPDAVEAAGYVVVEEDARISQSRSLNGFEVLADDTLILRAGPNRLYRATLYGSCARGLKFEWSIGVDTNGSSDIGKFSEVVVNGRRCPIRALDRVERVPEEAEGAPS